MPEPLVVGLVPNNGLDSGLTPVFILGRNFRNSSEAMLCRFGSLVTRATYLSAELILCLSPPQAPGAVVVEISTDENVWSSTRSMYHYRMCSRGSFCTNGEIEEVWYYLL